MEPRNTQYPVYIPDQYLTNKNLNDTTAYLEKEERATRSYTIGNGVIRGLDILEINKPGGSLTSIRISQGYGLTPDGFLLETHKDTSVLLSFATNEGAYHYINAGGRKYVVNGANAAAMVEAGTILSSNLNPINFVELFETQPDNTIDKRNIYPNINTAATKIAGFNLNNCVLVMVADVTDTKYDKCAQGDCNDRGTDKIIKCRYLLVQVTDLHIANQNKSFVPVEFMELPRMNNLSGIKSASEFSFKVTATFKKSIDIIESKLEDITTSGEGVLHTDLDLDAVKSILDKLQSASKISVYGLSFVNDLQQAINEYIAVYNSFATAYPLLATDRIDRIIVLALMSNTSTIDPYRYYYQAIQTDPCYIYQLQILLKHYERILALILCYTDVNKKERVFGRDIIIGAKRDVINKAGAVKIIPSKELHNLLGDKAIPYYYNLTIYNRLFTTLWKAHTMDINNQLVYNYNSVPFTHTTDILFNISSYNFFRIEGHLGVNKDDAQKIVSDLIIENDLCISLLSIDLNKRKTQSLAGVFTEFKSTLSELVKKVQKVDKDKKNFITLYRIQKEINTQSLTDLTGLKAKLNNLSAHLMEMIGYSKLDKSDPKRETIRENTPLRGFNTTKEDELLNIINNSGIIDAKRELEDAIKSNTVDDVLSIGNFIGTEYLGGAYKGGTFILLHDGDTVLGDCALPYYFFDKMR